ncbi:DNA processing protein [Gracilibacillus halophilus YIM-C55.5]|uniref:DNA processing protein n=1 Tax=Gracilibacillus halophilus YIM-C55.5 TaxID=1308866 RepID=N4WQ38_9BACI|nr:DNA-processing protein DprA [Gracilibacillus halophilus]ENH98252.1 DNA processing protein [Gracilibacillus halophilus YIM-C55.5]
MLEQQNWRLMHLHRIKGMTRPLLRKVLNEDASLSSIYQWTSTQWKETFHIDKERAHFIAQQLQRVDIKKKIVHERNNDHILTIYDPDFPQALRTIPDPPLVLYLLGHKQLLSQMPNISVIGTRYPSNQAETVMRYLLRPILLKNWTIISGMALGIDGLAHQLAIEYQTSTIAVLGCGFSHIYPKKHQALFDQLKQHHLIISEYPPETPPKKYHFPERNRIISGLSFATVVVEAKRRSGSLITVDQALEQGREVYAVPGSVLHETSEGCHQLIQDGAKLVFQSQDILEDWEHHRSLWEKESK